MLYLAWRNVARRLGQSAVTAIIIAVVTCVVAASAVAVVSLEHSVSLSRERLGADVMVLPVGASSSASEVLFTAQPVNVYLPDATGAAVARAGGVAQATPQFFTQTVNESCCSVVGITRIVGIDAATDFVLKPWVRGGAAIDLGPDGILVGAKAPAIEGDQVSILGSVFHVAGTLEETGTSMDETIFMDLQSARSIASGSPYLAGLWEDKDPFSCVSCIMVKTETGADAAQVAEAIMASCPGTVVVVASEVVAGASSQLSAVEALCAALLGALVVVAALALTGRFSALVSSRMAEWGLMRTLGVGMRGVLASVLCEVALVALTGALAGVVGAVLAATAALGIVHGALALPGAAPSFGAIAACALAGVAFALALSMLAVAYPVAKVVRCDPQETLAKGGL